MAQAQSSGRYLDALADPCHRISRRISVTYINLAKGTQGKAMKLGTNRWIVTRTAPFAMDRSLVNPARAAPPAPTANRESNCDISVVEKTK
jgi:hypothetical protein